MASSPVRRLEGRSARAGRALFLAAACAFALGACMSVNTQKVSMVHAAPADPVHVIQLSRAVIAALPNDTSVTLAAGSQWRRVGALPQGDVYRPLSGLFTIQTRRQDEAYPVASSGKLLGFYLPGEGAYMPLSRPVNLPVEMRQ